MDANLRTGAVCLLLIFCPQFAEAATAKSPNFVVTAPTDDIAQKVARCAEIWRKDLAIEWLGKELPNWFRPCPIAVKVGQIGAGGSTTFTFDKGEVFGWNMKVQGTLERILDSVIPHEVNHTIFATHFRRPLPRWADEGAATLCEHESERARQTHLLNQVIKTRRRIPLNRLLAIREYPADMQQVLTLYAEGYSLADYLVSQKGEKGRTVFLQFLDDAHRKGWAFAFKKHYGQDDLQQLEKTWTGWVLAGSPAFELPEDQLLAGADTSASNNNTVIRSQTPDSLEPLAHINRELRTVSRSTQSPVKKSLDRGRKLEVSSQTILDTKDARGDAGEPRLRSVSPQQKSASLRNREKSALPRKTLTPTADGISSHTGSPSYRFPKVRAF